MNLVAALLGLLGLALASTPAALAHPLSQGALDILVFPQKVQLKARVSTEQVLLVTALVPPQGNKNGGGMLAWEDYGSYLLKHLRVFIDDEKLAGRLVDVIPPDEAGATSGSQVEYVLEYPFLSEAGPTPPLHPRLPAEVRLEQDVLRDIMSAPGQSWEATFVVRIGQEKRAPLEGLLLTPQQPLRFTCDWRAPGHDATAGPRVDRWRLARDYLRHGFMHIMAGWDHLLFVGALVLAVTTWWDLVKVITAFTLAHTITLTLAVLNWVRLPEQVVEPMIAASIVLVALQNLCWPARSRGASRLLTAFFFGLFHGLGFAGGLLSAMAGMQGSTVGLAIAAFSVGVELGHQTVVLPVFALLKPMHRTSPPRSLPSRERMVQVGSGLILAAGLFYLFMALPKFG